MRWKAPIVAFAAVCLIGCTGSSGDGPTSSPDSVSTSATASSAVSSAPSAPSVPADVPTTGPNLRYRGERPPIEPVAALEHSAAGAKAFAEFFIKTIDWGFATMSGAYIRHFAAETCADCETFADGMDKAYREGHRYVGGRIAKTTTQVMLRRTNAGRAFVRFDITAFEELDAKGKFVSADQAHQGETFELSLAWQLTGRWEAAALAVDR